MKPFILVVLLVAVLATGVGAKMRARYYCPGHYSDDPIGDGSPDVYKVETFQKMVPGIWKDFDPETGFDNVSTQGDLTDAPCVSAEFWIDSVFEPKAEESRKIAPLLDGWASESDLVDPTYQWIRDGYCVLAAGGLRVEEPGTYEFKLDASAGAMVWIDRNGDGGIDLTSGEMTMGTELVNRGQPGESNCGAVSQLICTAEGIPVEYAFINENGTFQVDLVEAGLTKLMVWYWQATGASHIELMWKKPGGSMEPISGTNGDLGKPFGALPCVRIASLLINGEQKDTAMWSSLGSFPECTQFTFAAEASGFHGETPVYLWDFYGNGVEVLKTQEATVIHKYRYDWVSLVQPVVRVELAGRVSAPSSEYNEIQFILEDDPNVEYCHDTVSLVGRAAPERVAAVPSIFLHGSAVVASAAGRNIVRVYDTAGRLAVTTPVHGVLDLNSVGLTRGRYVVRMTHDGIPVDEALVILGR